MKCIVCTSEIKATTKCNVCKSKLRIMANGEVECITSSVKTYSLYCYTIFFVGIAVVAFTYFMLSFSSHRDLNAVICLEFGMTMLAHLVLSFIKGIISTRNRNHPYAFTK